MYCSLDGCLVYAVTCLLGKTGANCLTVGVTEVGSMTGQATPSSEGALMFTF